MENGRQDEHGEEPRFEAPDPQAPSRLERMNPAAHVGFLPRDRGGRAALGCLAVPLCLFLGLCAALVVTAMPQVPADILPLVLIGELVLSALFVVVLALVWAIAAPAWVAIVLERHVLWLLFVTLAFLLISTVAILLFA